MFHDLDRLADELEASHHQPKPLSLVDSLAQISTVPSQSSFSGPATDSPSSPYLNSRPPSYSFSYSNFHSDSDGDPILRLCMDEKDDDVASDDVVSGEIGHFVNDEEGSHYRPLSFSDNSTAEVAVSHDDVSGKDQNNYEPLSHDDVSGKDQNNYEPLSHDDVSGKDQNNYEPLSHDDVSGKDQNNYEPLSHDDVTIENFSILGANPKSSYHSSFHDFQPKGQNSVTCDPLVREFSRPSASDPDSSSITIIRDLQSENDCLKKKVFELQTQLDLLKDYSPKGIISSMMRNIPVSLHHLTTSHQKFEILKESLNRAQLGSWQGRDCLHLVLFHLSNTLEFWWFSRLLKAVPEAKIYWFDYLKFSRNFQELSKLSSSTEDTLTYIDSTFLYIQSLKSINKRVAELQKLGSFVDQTLHDENFRDSDHLRLMSSSLRLYITHQRLAETTILKYSKKKKEEGKSNEAPVEIVYSPTKLLLFLLQNPSLKIIETIHFKNSFGISDRLFDFQILKNSLRNNDVEGCKKLIHSRLFRSPTCSIGFEPLITMMFERKLSLLGVMSHIELIPNISDRAHVACVVKNFDLALKIAASSRDLSIFEFVCEAINREKMTTSKRDHFENLMKNVQSETKWKRS
ncbi:hypothetical protein P9112_013343 [Eukaryota sp. TZLM1-RC]